jgi:hypothetical protein
LKSTGVRGNVKAAISFPSRSSIVATSPVDIERGRKVEVQVKVRIRFRVRVMVRTRVRVRGWS